MPLDLGAIVNMHNEDSLNIKDDLGSWSAPTLCIPDQIWHLIFTSSSSHVRNEEDMAGRPAKALRNSTEVSTKLAKKATAMRCTYGTVALSNLTPLYVGKGTKHQCNYGYKDHGMSSYTQSTSYSRSKYSRYSLYKTSLASASCTLAAGCPRSTHAAGLNS